MYVKKLQKFLRVRNIGLAFVSLLGLSFIFAPQQVSAASTCETYGMTTNVYMECEINDCMQLFSWATDADATSMDRTYRVTQDLTCPGDMQNTPIGTSSMPFTGTFDGGGHSMLHVFIDGSNVDNYGLFGYTNDADISNLTINHAYVTISGVGGSHDNAGILIGNATGDTSITNVHVGETSFIEGQDNIGGLVGKMQDTTAISNSSVQDTTISASGEKVGGLVGEAGSFSDMGWKTIDKSFVSDITSITGTKYVGGLVGWVMSLGMTDVYARTAVHETSGGYSGGLIGFAGDSETKNAYAAGSISATGGSSGGLVGGYDGMTQILENTFSAVSRTGTTGGIYGTRGIASAPDVINSYFAPNGTFDNCRTNVVGNLTGCTLATDGNDPGYWLNSENEPMASWDWHFTWNLVPEDGDLPVFLNEGSASHVDWNGGDGSKGNPYTISDCYQLWQMREEIYSYFSLINDISCADIDNFIPVGSIEGTFFGGLNGNGYTIYDLTSHFNQDHVGLFGIVQNAVLKNITLSGFDVSGKDHVGPLAGTISGTTIVNNVRSEDALAWGEGRTGGLVGSANNTSSITYGSVVGADVSGSGGAYGGLVGRVGGDADTVVISRSYASDETMVTAGNDSAGGLVGEAGYVTIRDSYANTDIYEFNVGYSGGLVGAMHDSHISRTYAAGNLNPNHPNTAGGLVGYIYTTNNSISDSFSSMHGNFGGGIFGTSAVWPWLPLSNNYYDMGAHSTVCFAYAGVEEIVTEGSEPGCETAPGGGGSTEYWLEPNAPVNSWDAFSTWNFEPEDGNYPTLFGYREFKHVPFDSGNGNQGNPYIISDCQQLQNVSLQLDKWYVVSGGISTIDCSETVDWFDGKGFQPIGDNTAPFTGTFQGNNKNISDLHIDRANDLFNEQEGDERFVGLFGYLHGVEIGDINLVNARVRGYMYVGGFAGVVDDSYVANVHVNDYVEPNDCGDEGHCVWARFGLYGGGVAGYSTNSYVVESSSGGSVKGSGVTIGGIVGTAIEDSVLDTLQSSADVDGGTDIGGIVGRLEASQVIDSSASGDILVQTDDMKTGDAGGGLVGSAIDSEISGSDASGSVSGRDQLGGLVGYSDGSNISTSESFGGLIDGHSVIGGFIGFAANTNITDSDSYVEGVASSASYVGGFAGRALCNVTFENDTANTFVDGNSDAGGFAGLDNCNSGGDSATYINVEATGDVYGSFLTGGLIGESDGSTIIESRATGDVFGELTVGGFIGASYGPGPGDDEGSPMFVERSYATGNVTSTSTPAGGFIGTAENTDVEDSYARGDVNALNGAAGFAFSIEGSNFTHVYATGTVTGSEDHTAGLIREAVMGSTVGGYWNTDSGTLQSDNTWGTGASEADLKTVSTFTGWDFDEVWGLSPEDNNGFICLQWTDPAGCNIQDGGETDTDGDGIPDAIEDAGPNGGDSNNDNVADKEQANVTSFTNAVSGGYMVLETTCEANFNVQNGGESGEHKDAGYDYPAGLVAFVGTDCGAPGSTVDVVLYYYGNFDPAKLVLRKWADSAYSSISGAVLSSITIDNQTVLKAAYRVVDGGELDQDNTADSNIVDPVGLGQSVVGTPNTGLQTALQ